MATFKFAPNVPVAVELGYIDIVPSEKGPCQVRLKGTIGGEEKVYAYLPGDLPDTLTSLITAGIIGSKEYPTEVDKPVEVKPLRKQFTMMKEQLAGDKYGTFKVVGNGASAASPATAPAGATHAPKSYSDLYEKATDFIIGRIVPKYRAAKLEPTANDVHAMVSTLFIPKSRE